MSTISIQMKRAECTVVGIVVKCPDSRHALVDFEELGQQVLPTRFVIPVAGAVAQPVLRVPSLFTALVLYKQKKLTVG